MSGVDIGGVAAAMAEEGDVAVDTKAATRQIRKGAASAIKQYVLAQGGVFSDAVTQSVDDAARVAARRWWWPKARACWAWWS